ncbi:MAG: hypothetical protein QXI12_00395 [Candidatus Methanomethyliaceae archaeon]
MFDLRHPVGRALGVSPGQVLDHQTLRHRGSTESRTLPSLDEISFALDPHLRSDFDPSSPESLGDFLQEFSPLTEGPLMQILTFPVDEVEGCDHELTIPDGRMIAVECHHLHSRPSLPTLFDSDIAVDDAVWERREIQAELSQGGIPLLLGVLEVDRDLLTALLDDRPEAVQLRLGDHPSREMLLEPRSNFLDREGVRVSSELHRRLRWDEVSDRSQIPLL